MSLNKFTHIPLLKNDVQLKQKQKKTQRTTFKKKKKKRATPRRGKQKRRCPCLENQKKKKKKRQRCPKKKKKGNVEGICVKYIFQHFSSSFSSQIGRIKKGGPGGKIFLPIFCLSCFLSSTKQWKMSFSTLFFILSVFTPTKHTLNISMND